MGIFGNNKMTSEVDPLVFEENTDSTNSTSSISSISSISSTDFEQLSTSKANPSKYGINQAIKLVRSFQKHKISPNVIAGIMKQTLASVEIHFTDIIDDAKRKESAVHSESEKKDKQIEEATRKCEALKDEKIKLQQILEETVSVREFLLQAMDNGLSNHERGQQPAAQTSNEQEPQPHIAQKKEHVPQYETSQ